MLLVLKFVIHVCSLFIFEFHGNCFSSLQFLLYMFLFAVRRILYCYIWMRMLQRICTNFGLVLESTSFYAEQGGQVHHVYIHAIAI